jgi:hypothetical protein
MVMSITDWLLTGDVSMQYLTYRDLLGIERPDLRQRIALEGWGAKFLSCQKPDGHWGQGFYQTKWISSHYTLLDLKNLGIIPDLPTIRNTIEIILKTRKSIDGGINPAKTTPQSDVCVNGMFLNYAAYFRTDEEKLKSVVDFILSEQMADGGFNCWSNYSGARHSSLHTTLSIVEGIHEYTRNGYSYRLQELKKAESDSREFMLEHRLFKSHRTGQTINKQFLMLSWPSRWKYDILKALEYLASAGVSFDPRMADGLNVLISKRRPEGAWPLQARHPGKTHFEMEEAGKPSRWNTLRALKVLKHYGKDITSVA